MLIHDMAGMHDPEKGGGGGGGGWRVVVNGLAHPDAADMLPGLLRGPSYISKIWLWTRALPLELQ